MAEPMEPDELEPSELPPVDTRPEENLPGGDFRDQVVQQATRRIDMAYHWWRQNFDTSRSDVQFTYLGQWPAEVAAARENRPMLTFNVLPRFINRIIGMARQSKFSIRVMQISGMTEGGQTAGPAGREVSRSEMMEGLIRDIEVRSDASRAYARALQHALEGGFGWLVVRTRRPTDDPFEVELVIEHVKDRYSVLIDHMSDRQNYEDAQWCQISAEMPISEFRTRYPEAKHAGVTAGAEHNADQQWWGREDSVRVSDYWWKEPVTRVAERYESDSPNADDIVLYRDEAREIGSELTARGYRRVQSRPVQTFQVRYMRHTWAEVLDGPRLWPSSMLPVVPVLGRQVDDGGVQHYQGVVRHARDPMQTMNYWMSSMTERVALAPKAPWILTPNQIAGHEGSWHAQSEKNLPFLLYNFTPEEPPPQRIAPPSPPAAEMNIVALVRDMMMDTVGIHDAALGRRSNETSGLAIDLRSEASETGAYEYVDNLARSITCLGDVLVDMIPRIYTQKKARRLVLADDESVLVDLNMERDDPDTGQTIKVAAVDKARYRCRTDVAPATRSQREAFLRWVTEWGKTDPQGFASIRDLIVDKFDVPQSRELRDRFRKMVPPQFLTEEQRQQLPPQEPSPEEIAQQKQAEADIAKAESQAAVAEANRQKAAIELEIKRAEADQAGAEAPADEPSQLAGDLARRP